MERVVDMSNCCCPEIAVFDIVIIAVIVWLMAGVLVMAPYDEDGQLFEWSKRIPLGYNSIILFWPLFFVIAFCLRFRVSSEKQRH